jgi:hypothetical protein
LSSAFPSRTADADRTALFGVGREMKLVVEEVSYADAADALGSENTSHSRAAKVR